MLFLHDTVLVQGFPLMPALVLIGDHRQVWS